MKPIMTGAAIVMVLLLVFTAFKSIPAGHVGMATLFGKARETPYERGLHFPVSFPAVWMSRKCCCEMLYFIKGDSPQPLPLMHIGEAIGGTKSP